MNPTQTDDKPGIWWLASYPKSGNTWVRMFLQAYMTHQRLEINTPYQVVVDDLWERHYQSVCAAPLSELTDAQKTYLRPAALLHMLHHNGESFFKTHNANLQVCGIRLIPREVTKGVIYVVRHPRDVAMSYAAHTGMTPMETIEFMQREDAIAGGNSDLWHLVSSWPLHVASWTEESNYPVHVIQYEEMFRAPHHTFRMLIEFLGQEVDYPRMDFAIKQSSLRNLMRLEDEGSFKEKTEHQERFFGQKHDGVQREAVNGQLGFAREVMEKLGYQ